MVIVNNLKTIKALCKKYNMQYDTQNKYIIAEPKNINRLILNNKEYILKYYDGCFYPYIVMTGRVKLCASKAVAMLYDLNPDINVFGEAKTAAGDTVLLCEMRDGDADWLFDTFYNVTVGEVTQNYAQEIKHRAIRILKEVN